MSGLDRGRVAEILVDDDSSAARRGSGYLVSPGMVLTAGHVVRGAVSLRVRFNADRDDEWSSVGEVLFADPSCDLAWVGIDSPGYDSDGLPPVQFGRVGERAAVLPCVSVGFPRFKLRDDAPDDAGIDEISRYRDVAHVEGKIPSLSNWRSGSLEFLLDGPPEHDVDSSHSPWEGMSGAAVWCGDRIVGVVSLHHRRDGLMRLTAEPLTAAYLLPPERLSEVIQLAGWPNHPNGLLDVIPSRWEDNIREGYAALVEDIAPDRLEGRDEELAALTRFCAGSEPYQWWQADPWHGKTALASWLVLHPPAGVTVVSFFVTGRLSGQADSGAFTEALIEQLAVIAGEPGQPELTAAARDRQRRRLLNTAAEQVAAAGGRLLLVVDGLDEDRGFRPNESASIASLLPKRPNAGLRVLVTSRPRPGIPMDVAPGHPLRECEPLQLTRSQRAKDVELLAKAELYEQLTGNDRVQVDILGYIAASGGGLTIRELAELTKAKPFDLVGRLGTVFGRSLSTRSSADPDQGRAEPVLIFGHEVLREIAETELSGELGRYRTRIDKWVAKYRGKGWPDHAPRFVWRPYARLLTESQDVSALVRLALDRRRHDQMLWRTFGDVDALQELLDAHRLLIEHPEVHQHLGQLVAMSLERDRLASRNRGISPALPAVWSMLGEPERALTLARSIPDEHQQSEALVAITVTFCEDGHFDEAERVARSIPVAWRRVGAFDAIATGLVKAKRVDEAERLSRGDDHELIRSHRLRGLARAMAAAGLVGDAERVARSLPRESDQQETLKTIYHEAVFGGFFDEARRLDHVISELAPEAYRLAWLANQLALAGRTAEAQRIAHDAERLARSEQDRNEQVASLALVAEALAAAGCQDEALRIADEVIPLVTEMTDAHRVGRTLGAVVRTFLHAGKAADAKRVAESVSDGIGRGDAVTLVVEWLVGAGRLEEAAGVARSLTDSQGRGRALTVVVERLLADGRPEEAEGLARSLTDRDQQLVTLTMVAERLAEDGRTDDAERIARTLARESECAQALVMIARTLAKAGRRDDATRFAQHAERLARTRTDERQRFMALNEMTHVLVRIGRFVEAEGLARSFTEHGVQGEALMAFTSAMVGAGRLEEAERLARSFTDDSVQGEALTVVAFAMVGAGRLEDAERLARSFTDDGARDQALTAVASAMVGVSRLEDAERLARSFTDDGARDQALMAVGSAMVGAGRLQEAERLARTLADLSQQVEVLTEVAIALGSAGQANSAERVASSISDEYARVSALAGVAQELAGAGQQVMAQSLGHRAEDIARTFTDRDRQASAREDIVRAMAAAGSTDDAVRLARTIPDERDQGLALDRVAHALAAAGRLDIAEQVARSISNDSVRVQALHDIAQRLVESGRAEDAESLGYDAGNGNGDGDGSVLSRVAATLAAVGLAETAERIARSIADEYHKVPALGVVARELALLGRTDDAERIARSIADKPEGTWALTAIAQTLADDGRTIDANRLALEAERSARAMPFEGWPESGLASIALAYAAAGSSEEAERLAVELLLSESWVEAVSVLLQVAGVDWVDQFIFDWVG